MNRSWRTFLESVALVGSFLPNPVVKALSLGVGIIISSLPVKRRQTAYTGDTYSWEHKANRTATEGTPMPVIYGRTRVKPVLKNRFIRMEKDKQYLYALYSFACHSIDQRSGVPDWTVGRTYSPGEEVKYSVTPGKTYVCTFPHVADTVFNGTVLGLPHAPVTDTRFWRIGKGTADITEIKINGRDIDTFTEVVYETRPGLPLQTLITGFDKTYTNFPQDSTSVNMAIPVPLLQHGVAVFYFKSGKWQCSRHQMYYAGTLYWVKGNPDLGRGKVYWTAPASASEDSYYSTSSGTFEICDFHNSGNANSTTWTWKETQPVLPSEWYTVDVTVGTTQNIQVDLRLPNGLYAVGTGDNTAGKIYPAPCRLFMEYRKRNGDGSYGSWFGFPFMMDESLVTSREVANGAEVYLVRATAETIYLSFRARIEDVDELLDEAQYQVRVAAIAPADVELTNVAAITYGDFTYPGEPLLGIKALASDKISGDVEVSGVCDRGTVWVRTSSGWVLKSANNAAWAVYDILAQGHADHPATPKGAGVIEQSRYGCGIVYSKLDYTTFNTWANYLSDNGYHCNTVFDEWTTAWDAVLRICGEFRGMITPIGTRYYALVDKPETPAQLFSMGNILEGSFVQTWPNRNSRAGSLEITYWDKDRGHEAVSFLIRGTKWEELDPARITLYGTTDYEQALTIGTYFMNCNDLLMSIVELEVGVSELQAGVGDVVWVQHDVPEWGWGGRVRSFYTGVPVPGTDSVELDLTMTYEVGNTYEIILRHAGTDLVERHTLTNTPGDSVYARTAAGAWTTAPAAGDVYAIGIVSDGVEIRVKQYRIIDIRRGGTLTKRLTLLEYNGDVYQAPPDIPNIGLAKAAATTFNEAVNVKAVEKQVPRPTGEYEPGIEVSFDPVQGDTWGEWEVVFRDVDASDRGWIGEWTLGTTYNMFDKVYYGGKTYMSLVDGNTGVPSSIG